MKRKFIIASLCLTMPLAFVLIVSYPGANGRYARSLAVTYYTSTTTTTATNAGHSVVMTSSNSAPASQTNTVPQAK